MTNGLNLISNVYSPNCILSTFFSNELNKPLDLLNIYGPHEDREVFWNDLVDSGLLYSPFIRGCDLNLITSIDEKWGSII